MIMYLYKKIAITDRELFLEIYRERFRAEKENCNKEIYNKEICNKDIYGEEIYNKKTCNKEAYIEHLVKLAKRVDLMILREKNLNIEEYKNLAQNLLAALENKDMLVLHTHIESLSN